MQSNTENIKPQFAKLPPILGASRRMVCAATPTSPACTCRKRFRGLICQHSQSATATCRSSSDRQHCTAVLLLAGDSHPGHQQPCSPLGSSSSHGTCASSPHPVLPCQRRPLCRPGFCLGRALCRALAVVAAAWCLAAGEPAAGQRAIKFWQQSREREAGGSARRAQQLHTPRR